MERLIFNHKDMDRDELEVKEPDPYELGRHRGSLLFVVESDDLEPRSVALTPAKVDELIGALERWRSGVVTARETSTPPADLNPIYDAIVKRLTDEWLPRVLPLHQAPQAATWAPTVFPTTSCHRNGNHGPESLCSDCTVDPEPHDVGHAEEPSEHRPQDCPGAPACEEAKPHPANWSDLLWGGATCDAPLQPDQILSEVHAECGLVWAVHNRPAPGRLMGELLRWPKPLSSLYCDGCKHLWSDHGRFNIRGCHAPGPSLKNDCECSRVQPCTS